MKIQIELSPKDGKWRIKARQRFLWMPICKRIHERGSSVYIQKTFDSFGEAVQHLKDLVGNW